MRPERKHWKQHPVVGGILSMTGIPCLLGGMFILLNQRFNPDANESDWISLGGSALGIAAVVLIQAGRSLARPRAEDVLANDHRPLILYLRSFNADERGQPRSANPARSGGMGLLGRALTKSFEEKIDSALATVGPFIAVGDPGERTPPSGAARLYLSSAEWRERVTELMDRAACIIIQAGDSPGLAWEVAEVVQKCDPTQLLIALPAGTEYNTTDCKIYEQFRSVTKELFPVPLPDPSGDARFVYFDKTWRPMLLQRSGRESKNLSDSPALQRSVLEQLQKKFKRTVLLQH